MLATVAMTDDGENKLPHMILVAGSANLDFVVRVPHIAAPGETVLGHDFQTFCGGKGANQAVACARAAGTPTHFLLALGHDAFAAQLQAALKEANVQLHPVRVSDQATGTAFISVSDDAQNAITVAPGANGALRGTDLPALDGFTHLLLQLEIPLATVLSYAQAAHAQGVKVVLNAAPALPLPPQLLALVDLLIVNEIELAAIAPASGDIDLSLSLINVPCVIVTLGQRGCRARSEGVLHELHGFDVAAIDSTGAGDTFCGVLVASLSGGHALPQAMRRANAAAAIACTRLGAQSSIPTLEEVDAFLACHADAADA